MKPPAYKHQIEAFALSKDKPAYALFMEMGTGKSRVAIDTAEYLFTNNLIDSVVIVSPNGVNQAWIDNQFPTHCDLLYACFLWSGLNTKRAKEGWGSFLRFTVDCDNFKRLKILSIHIDAVITKDGYNAIERFLKKHRSLLIIDESTRIKNAKARRTKALLKLGKLAEYRRILTGTPVTQSIGDLYSQFAFLDPDILGHESWFTFCSRYMNKSVGYGPGGRTFTKFEGVRYQDELQELIKPYSYRVLKKDCLDLPDKVYNVIHTELSKEQRLMYDTLKNEFLIWVDNTEISAPMVLQRLTKLQQIMGGFVNDTETNTIYQIQDNPIPRLEALQEIIQETAQETKIVIWARFRYEIKMIVNYLISLEYNKQSIVEYHGGVDKNVRHEQLTAFQNDNENKYKFFISNVRTGGIGLDLTAANVVVYYSNTFSYEDRSQSEDRCHRSGQKNKVTYYDIQAKDTIDKNIINTLRDKKDVADMITNNIRSFVG